ncbi:MAG TPA: hypothetical protein VIH76_05570 [Candidatus Acidoferrales bacterium]
MTDWIDKLREKRKALAESGQTQEELALHAARVIRAKAPEFWDSFLERLQTDSCKLKEVFPNNLSCQCTAVKTASGCELRGCKLPWRELRMRLNVDEQSVDIDEHKREAPDRIIPAGYDEIRITVNDYEELEFTYKGRAHITPGSLAQHLIEYVCGSLSFVQAIYEKEKC